jgi:hypothetical protein
MGAEFCQIEEEVAIYPYCNQSINGHFILSTYCIFSTVLVSMKHKNVKPWALPSSLKQHDSSCTI